MRSFEIEEILTYEFRVSTPRCVYVISELIWSSSRLSRHTRSFAMANSAFNNSGSCRVLIELLDEYTAGGKKRDQDLRNLFLFFRKKFAITYNYFD